MMRSTALEPSADAIGSRAPAGTARLWAGGGSGPIVRIRRTIIAFALLCAAALSATPKDVSADVCTDDTAPSGAFWSACLTVGVYEPKPHQIHSNGIVGYQAKASFGGLSDTEFTSDSTNYTVKQLTFLRSRFYAVLDPDPGGAADNWVLHLGDDVTISFSDAEAWTYCRAGPGPCSPVRVAGGYRWRSPGFSWTADNENDTISVSLVSVASNNEPTVANAIPNQRAEVDKAFSYTFPANTFSDSDNHGLSYKVVPADGGILDEAGGVLPDWLSFDASTRTFSGTPKSEDRGVVRVRVTAYDGHGGSVWDTFYITVYRSSWSGMRVRDGFLHGLNGPGGGAMPWMPWSLGTESSGGSGPSGSPRSGTAVESCRVNVDVRFLDANGDAVEVDSLTASDFTVENGSVGTPVKSDSVWRVTVTADPGYSGAMRVRLQSREPFVLPDPDHSEIEFSEMEAELWEASELVFRVSAGDSDCAPVARNTLASLALDGLALDPSFDAATTAYAAAAESDTAQVTVTASAVYGAASVAFAPGDADTEADGHQVALAEGETQVTVTVTPGDGNAAQTYAVTVTRETAEAAVPQVAATQVPANWSLIPAGLSPGDRFRLLAVTSTKRHARVNSVRFYNAHVQTAVASGHADIRSHGPDFAALGCTGDVDARTNTATAWTSSERGVPVYWLGGARVADDYADLYDGGWASNAATDESGEPSSHPKVFTGCASDGTVGDPLGGRWVDIGQPGNAGEEMTDGATRTLRTMLRPLYALSPVFEVAPAPVTPPASGVLTGFVLVDASSDADLGAVTGGATVSVSSDGSYGIRAEVEADAEVGSVVLSLAGPGAEDTHTQTESVAPYSLYGDAQGAEHGQALAAGSYTLTATAYAESGGAGDVLGTLTVPFTVAVETPPPASGVLTGFVLVDVSDQSTVTALSNGASIDLEGSSGGSFGIRANVASDAEVGSVALSLSGAKTVSRTEGLAPYSLYGDHNDGNRGRALDGASLPAGSYTLSATAYAEAGASGTVLGTRSVSFDVLAPARLSVADARAEEGTDATLDFAVTLDRSSTGTVTVDYATADGTATAEDRDYTATSGTLTFAPGEREKTIAVAVLDDAHDEGEETMTLRLSNAQGAVIADGEATGTITNSDPIQKMWLARFGRTVGSQVVDAVAERLGTPLAGAQVTLGGQGVDLTRTEDGEALAQALVGVARMFGAQTMEDDADAERSGAGAWQRSDAWDRPATGAEARSMSERDVLLGSAFHFSRSADDGGPGFAAWGRVSAGGFDAEEAHEKGPVDMDGEVTTGIVGADAAWERWLAGVAVSVSEGEGTYAYGDVGEGALESTLTGVHPYARLEVSERVQAWGLLGFGAGRMTMRPEGRDPIETDIDMRLGAVGAQGALMEASETGGLDLLLKADAFLVQMESARAANTEATSADASRARVTLAGSRTFALGERAALTPGLEVGLRHDGGDAETGTGVELGGRIAYANAASGLTVEAGARTLITHDDSGYEEWGASGSVRLDPGASGRGLSLTVAPTLGAASSGLERLWSLRDARELANDDEFEAEGRLDAELGYGLPVFGAFTGTPYAGLGLSDRGRDYRLGWRLAPGGTALDFELGVEGTWSAPADDDADRQRGVMLRGSLRW